MERRADLTIRGDSLAYGAVAEFEPEAPQKLLVKFDGRVVEGQGEDLFACLVAVRRELEGSGLQICCQGARRNVYPSGMSRQMSGGRLAYQLERGRTPTRDDLVDILDSASCDEVTTVDEQRAYTRQLRGRG